MRAVRLVLIGAAAVVCLWTAPLMADMISLSGAENSRNIAEIRVDATGVQVALEVFPADLEFFMDALSDDWFTEPDPNRPSEAERLRRFARESLQVLADGHRLPTQVRQIEPRMRVERFSPLAGKINPFTRRLVPGPPQDKRVLFFELFYPFPEGDPPAALTLIPPLGDNGFAKASIGFVLFHDEAPVVDFSALTEPSVLDLDWEDPWYSRFRKRTLKRWQDAGMMTYLYIEPYEVRHEVLVRVQDMLPLLDLGLRSDQWIEEDEFKRVEAAIGEFLLRHSNVLIDGRKYPGILDRINFVQYSRRQTLFLTQPERLRLATAMLGVVVTYLTEGLPQEVTMDWDLFTDRVVRVPANAIDPAGPFPTYLTPDDPIHTWTNFLKTYTIPTVEAVAVDEALLSSRSPWLTVAVILGLLPLAFGARRAFNRNRPVRGTVLVGIALLIVAVGIRPPSRSPWSPTTSGPDLEPEQQQQILGDLLKNVYRAFDLRDEEAVYDKLSLTVAGDLLENIFLQSRRSFAVEQAGGAQAKVQEIAIEQIVTERDGNGFRFDSQWTAAGSVGHWGHTHLRINRYRALITIQPRDGSWRITAMEILEETRIDPFADPASSSQTGSDEAG